MPKPSDPPEFEWGHIIQVPAVAICRHGIDPAYGRFYGVVVSSGHFWETHRKHERKLQKELKQQKQEFEERKKDSLNEAKCDDLGNLNQEGEEFNHRLLKSPPAGQYLVALISKSVIYPELDTRITSECRFKHWYIAAGLFIIVMEHQLKSIPVSERCWGKLNGRDEAKFRKRIGQLMQKNDWKRLRQRIEAESEPARWYQRLIQRLCGRFTESV